MLMGENVRQQQFSMLHYSHSMCFLSCFNMLLCNVENKGFDNQFITKNIFSMYKGLCSTYIMFLFLSSSTTFETKIVEYASKSMELCALLSGFVNISTTTQQHRRK
jgi:hypothetical protein